MLRMFFETQCTVFWNISSVRQVFTIKLSSAVSRQTLCAIKQTMQPAEVSWTEKKKIYLPYKNTHNYCITVHNCARCMTANKFFFFFFIQRNQR